MVDVTDSKSVGGDTVWVRVPPPAPRRSKLHIACSDFFYKKVRVRSFRCSSFSNRKRCAGLRFDETGALEWVHLFRQHKPKGNRASIGCPVSFWRIFDLLCKSPTCGGAYLKAEETRLRLHLQTSPSLRATKDFTFISSNISSKQAKKDKPKRNTTIDGRCSFLAQACRTS